MTLSVNLVDDMFPTNWGSGGDDSVSDKMITKEGKIK
jgi:hypothetical protein